MAVPNIIYQDISPTGKINSEPSATDIEPYVDLDDLKLDVIQVPYFTTLEHNDWALDGQHPLFPEDEDVTDYHWGMVSESISGADGAFATPPVLTIDFTSLQQVVAITLDFDHNRKEWCNSVRLTFYRSGTQTHTEVFSPNAARYACVGDPGLFDKLEVTFLSTSVPYRRARLEAIYYGIIRNFTVDELMSLSVLEEVNPISSELSINTAEFTVKNTTPIPFLFQKMQPLQIMYGDKLIGTFFIDVSKRTGVNRYELSAIDGIGVLDSYTFLGGIYNNKNVGDLVDEIFDGINILYTIDPSLEDLTVTGYIPICTAREALMQIAFVIGAVVDTSRSETINIKVLDDTVQKVFTDLETHDTGSVDIVNKLTEVQVTAYNFTVGTETTKLLEDTLLAGTYTIRFNDPYTNYVVTGATVVSSGANYVKITVASETQVTITGTEYIESQVVYSKRNPDLTAFDVENVKQVTSCTLVNRNNVVQILERVYNYCMRTDTNNMTVILGDAQVGDVVTLPTVYKETATGRIISNQLSFGSKLRGAVKVLVD